MNRFEITVTANDGEVVLQVIHELDTNRFDIYDKKSAVATVWTVDSLNGAIWRSDNEIGQSLLNQIGEQIEAHEL